MAQFIGSPAMNIVPGLARVDVVEALGQRWPMSVNQATRDGLAVHYGIRPGDLELAGPGQGIEARVVVVEPTGAETELLVDVGGQQLTVVIHGRTGAKPDDPVFLIIDAAKAHVFDAQSGQRLF